VTDEHSEIQQNGRGRGPRRIAIVFALLAVAAVALGFYALHLKRKVVRDEQTAAEQQLAVTPQSNRPPENVTLYVANDNDGTVGKSQVSVPMPVERSERARAALRTLLTQYLKPDSTHPIGKDSDVRQVFLMEDGTAIVDTNSVFADAHPSGVLAEELTVSSLVLTLNANDSGITRVKILVNGQQRDTLAGHADLKRFYEVGSIGQAMK
jgi:sporulation and spore germination protein